MPNTLFMDYYEGVQIVHRVILQVVHRKKLPRHLTTDIATIIDASYRNPNSGSKSELERYTQVEHDSCIK